jgi:membrane protein implicated in regulation of membrane protease activity
MKLANGRYGRTGRIFGAPILLAALTVFGLLAALLGEGWWHALAWLALSIPLVSIVWCVLLRGARSRSGQRAGYLPGSRHQVSGR